MSATIDDTESKKDFSTCFIHSVLDDYGLTQAQFRVFCRIARRGECNESAPNIARGCKMNQDTVWDAISFLEAHCLITRKHRPGHTSILTINPVSQWATPGGKQGVTEKRGHPRNSATGYPKTGDTHPAENEGHKGNPSEGNPNKGISPLENLKNWQLRKDLRETTDPSEREAIKAEINRRKVKFIRPVTPKAPTSPQVEMTDEQRKECAEQVRQKRETL